MVTCTGTTLYSTGTGSTLDQLSNRFLQDVLKKLNGGAQAALDGLKQLAAIVDTRNGLDELVAHGVLAALASCLQHHHAKVDVVRRAAAAAEVLLATKRPSADDAGAADLAVGLALGLGDHATEPTVVVNACRSLQYLELVLDAGKLSKVGVGRTLGSILSKQRHALAPG
jgi:hypothetical protein